MKVYDVKNNVEGSGEYILGAKQTGSHACYLIYGVMDPGEKSRELKAGKGHEELLLAVAGNFKVTGHYEGELREGEAIHLVGDEIYLIENMTDVQAVYILAGGHTEGHHHH